MDFDLQWLLLGLPLAFALGWAASRIDLRQWKREQREAPQAYSRGLSLLLNEQHDKAIDAFIEAVQQDPDSADLHFALGNMFRRRGEYERAVRVHEHLLKRADLPAAQRLRAQDALAQDFMKAGLLDRAEQAYRALEGTSFDTEARLALLTLHERSRDWPAAIADARKLEQAGAASFAARIAHYWCEIAEEADARQQDESASDALQQARQAAPLAARPLIQAGQRHARRGEPAQALEAFAELLVVQPASFALVARDYAAAALACGQAARGARAARRAVPARAVRRPARGDRAARPAARAPPRAAARPPRERTRRSARRSSCSRSARRARWRSTAADAAVLAGAVGHAARPLQRYRCAACGFESQRYFWQCPGCMAWDSYPTQRLEDLA